jgi:release factor glutamine methyltransferase
VKTTKDCPKHNTSDQFSEAWLVSASEKLSKITDFARKEARELQAIARIQQTCPDSLLKRRLECEPMAHIRGWEHFYNRSFKVTRDTLIPRPETEILLDLILKANCHSSTVSVLDLCCGSGILGITSALERSHWKVTLSDLSWKALEVSKANCISHGVPSVAMLQADLLYGLKGPFHLIISNPPYVSHSLKSEMMRDVLEYEPHMALFSENGGLNHIEKIIQTAESCLHPGGMLCMETGHNHKEDITNFLKTSVWKHIIFLPDYSGFYRFLFAVKQGTPLWNLNNVKH